MFYLRTLNHKVKLSPQYFTSGIFTIIRQKLIQEVTSEWCPHLGSVCCVLKVTTTDMPLLQSHDDLVDFPVRYECLIYCPLRGEVVEGVIKRATNNGLFSSVGNLECFIAKLSFPSYMQYREDKGEAIVQHNSTEMERTYNQGQTLRVRIEGTRQNEAGLFATGTISMAFLGLTGCAD